MANLGRCLPAEKVCRTSHNPRKGGETTVLSSVKVHKKIVVTKLLQKYGVTSGRKFRIVIFEERGQAENALA
jgi:hypothetical protein